MDVNLVSRVVKKAVNGDLTLDAHAFHGQKRILRPIVVEFVLIVGRLVVHEVLATECALASDKESALRIEDRLESTFVFPERHHHCVQAILDSQLTSSVPSQVALQDEATGQPVWEFHTERVFPLASRTRILLELGNLHFDPDKATVTFAHHVGASWVLLQDLVLDSVGKLCLFFPVEYELELVSFEGTLLL